VAIVVFVKVLSQIFVKIVRKTTKVLSGYVHLLGAFWSVGLIATPACAVKDFTLQHS
jgi:hypothetical protein